MKTAFIFALILLSFFSLDAQDSIKTKTDSLKAKEDTVKVKNDTVNRARGNDDQQLKVIKEKKVELHSDSTNNQPVTSDLIDSTKQNKYGDLLVDDPEYNKKYPLWIPAVEVFGINTLLNVVDRYALKLDFANVNPTTWKRTISAGWPWGPGWEWDQDRFANNFISHPYTGSLYYNAARSNGYSFLLSATFAMGGSYMWKIFGEKGTPEREDPINTTSTGIFLGEILYRLSSNILDDRTRGGDRVFREIMAGLVDPIRGINRLFQGKTFRTTNKEVYAKEPVNISLYSGIRKVDAISGNLFDMGSYSWVINAQLDYGNPFEIRSRKPYDFFKFRVDANFNVGRKWLDNVNGYGILFGKNYQLGNLALLVGGFQYYDYWDNTTFELGSLGFGGGVVSKLPLSKTSNLYTSIHLAIVPFAGNSRRAGPDLSQVRDYNYGSGLEARFESTVNLGKYATGTMLYYFYGFRPTFDGPAGNNFMHILRPRITVRLYKFLSIGAEDYLYYNDRYENGLAPLHLVRSEQKIFLLIFLEDKQRRGYYN
jgi:hypothetical protein